MFQALEPVGPHVVDEGAHLVQSLGSAEVHTPVAGAANGDEVGEVENSEMLRHGGPAQVLELGGELTGRSFVVADQSQDPAPGGIRHGLGGEIEPKGLRGGPVHVSIILHRVPERKFFPTIWSLTMETLDALAQTFDHTESVIAGVRPDQMTAATPCAEWDVRSLLTHTVGVVANIGNGVRGGEMFDPNGIALEDDVARQFRDAAASTLAAWHAVGLDGEANIGAGPMPASMAANINLVDTTTHAWDIARATGQAEEIPGELAGSVLAAAQGFLNDDIRSFAGIGPAIPVGADATPTQALVAFLGRRF